MSALAKLQHRRLMRRLVEEGEQRAQGQAIFTKMRNRYVALLCAYIRVRTDAKLNGTKLPEPYRDRDWCNAAVSILTLCPYEIQDEFLRADAETKDKFVQAVLEDGGVVDMADHFNELPVML